MKRLVMGHIYVFFVFSILLSGSMIFPAIESAALSPNSDQMPLSSTLQQKVGEYAQHFGFICYALVARTSKPMLSGTSYTKKDAEIIKKIAESYGAIIDETRKLTYQGEESVEKAVAFFYENLAMLCSSIGCDPFGKSLPEYTSSFKQLLAIKTYVDALEKRFNAIVPVAPLLTRLKNRLCYNFISTEMIPRALINFGGPVVTIRWAMRNYAIHSRNIDQHPHNHPWGIYKKCEHATGKSQDLLPANFLERILGINSGMMERVSPCLEQENICNGPDIPAIDPATGLQKTEVKDGVSKPLWVKKLASKCKAECNACYRYEGYKPLEQVFAKLAYACRPLSAILGFYLLGTYIREAQLPEYNNRIKLKQNAERESVLAQEMRTRKVCYEKTIGFKHIKGYSEIIDREMRMIVDYLRNPFRYYNSASGIRSLLLYGPPGTGKTLMARAIAKESGAPFIELDADDVLSENAKEKIIATLAMAEHVAVQRPEKSAIIYIDEVDAVTGNRQHGTLDAQRSKALANLLAIFDGVEKRNPYVHIVIILATNHYQNLDPALLRPGRIDRKVLLSVPGPEARREFFEDLLPVEHAELTQWFVEKTAGCSGAQIVSILDAAQMIAAYNNRSMPCKKDYESALQNSQAEQRAIPENAQVH